MGLDVSVRPGWTPVWACWVSPEPADTFSSSLLLRQAALGFKLRSVDSEFKIKKPMFMAAHHTFLKESISI